jgi:hypothetical protein
VRRAAALLGLALAAVAACGGGGSAGGSAGASTLEDDLDRFVRKPAKQATTRAELDRAVGGCVAVVGKWQAREPALRRPDFDPFTSEAYARACTLELTRARLALGADCERDPALVEGSHATLLEHGHTALAAELKPELDALRARCPE